MLSHALFALLASSATLVASQDDTLTGAGSETSPGPVGTPNPVPMGTQSPDPVGTPSPVPEGSPSPAPVGPTDAPLGANSLCEDENRVRKPWHRMDQHQKILYIEALEEAMDQDGQNLVQKFAQIHLEKESEAEAHKTCGFILWHRRFLLAYENMLRSLKPKFRCVTIPYIDTVEAFRKQNEGTCSNLQECCPLVQDLGGSSNSVSEMRTFGDLTYQGQCYTGRPFTKYLDKYEKPGVIRSLHGNDGKPVPVPQTNDLTILIPAITGQDSASYEKFAFNLMNGIHIDFHLSIGGLMGTMGSPYDPIFYSWHAVVDMYHYVWHRCKVGGPLVPESNLYAQYGFNQEKSCYYYGTNKAPMTVHSEMTMKIGNQDITADPWIGKYFVDLSPVYSDYVDTLTIKSEFRYSYEQPAVFDEIGFLNDKNMCPSAPAVAPRPPTQAPSNGTLTYVQWYVQTRAELETIFDDPNEVDRQIKLIACLGFNEKFGVVTFDDAFKENMMLTQSAKPECESMIEDVANNKTTVAQVNTTFADTVPTKNKDPTKIIPITKDDKPTIKTTINNAGTITSLPSSLLFWTTLVTIFAIAF